MSDKRKKIDMEELTRLALEGVSIDDLAAKYGRHRTTIHERLRNAGVQWQKPRLATRLEEMQEMYAVGTPVAKIAEKMGCRRETVNKMLRSAGVPTRTDEARWPHEAMIRWYEVDGLTCKEIGDRLGTSHKTVNRVLRRIGVTIRRSGPGCGEKHPRWKNGRVKLSGGYIGILLPDHPMAVDRYVPEHRLVMANHLGRMLTSEEVVHHRNDCRSDNRIENLQLFASNAEHLAETLTGKKHSRPGEKETWKAKMRTESVESVAEKFGLDPEALRDLVEVGSRERGKELRALLELIHRHLSQEELEEIVNSYHPEPPTSDATDGQPQEPHDEQSPQTTPHSTDESERWQTHPSQMVLLPATPPGSQSQDSQTKHEMNPEFDPPDEAS